MSVNYLLRSPYHFMRKEIVDVNLNPSIIGQLCEVVGSHLEGGVKHMWLRVGESGGQFVRNIVQ